MKMPSRRGIFQWIGIVITLILIAGILYKVNIQADRVDALYAALGDEQSAAEDRGETPVAPDPEDLVDDPNYQGPQGERGEPGEPGSDGRGVSSVQCVEGIWVVYYTDQTVDRNAGDCTGDKGPAGADGKDGTDGQNGQDGQPGSPGTDGTDGQDGRGITDAQCDPATGRWEITYTDGATEDGGPCISSPLGN